MYVNAEMISVETIPEIVGGMIRESSGVGEFKYNIFDALQEPL
jgi:hypothetical protein